MEAVSTAVETLLHCTLFCPVTARRCCSTLQSMGFENRFERSDRLYCIGRVDCYRCSQYLSVKDTQTGQHGSQITLEEFATHFIMETW